MDIHVLRDTVVNQRGIKGFLFILHTNVLEREIRQFVLVTFTDVEEVFSGHLDVTDGDVVALRQGHVLTVLRLEELRPGADNEERAALAGDVLDGDVFIVLGRVGAHLEPEHAGSRPDMTAAQDDVAVVERL